MDRRFPGTCPITRLPSHKTYTGSMTDIKDQRARGPLPWMRNVRCPDQVGQGFLTLKLWLTDNLPPLQRSSNKMKKCNWGGEPSEERGSSKEEEAPAKAQRYQEADSL